MTTRFPPSRRDDYSRLVSITTRWSDNDVYGHVNNVVFYAFFDTAVNQLLIDGGLLDPGSGSIIGLVVESQCRYAAPIAFPDRVVAGVRVARLGASSVRYEIGLFRNDDDVAAGEGHFVHVYVDRTRRRPTPLPDGHRRFLETLQRSPDEPIKDGASAA